MKHTGSDFYFDMEDLSLQRRVNMAWIMCHLTDWEPVLQIFTSIY